MSGLQQPFGGNSAPYRTEAKGVEFGFSRETIHESIGPEDFKA